MSDDTELLDFQHEWTIFRNTWSDLKYGGQKSGPNLARKK